MLQILIVILVLLIVIVLKLPYIEHFYVSTNTVTQVATADPLVLDPPHIYDPTGWRWDSNNTISTVIKIKAKTGQMDTRDIMAVPTLGYHQNSGLEYSSWNKIQGTNGWGYLNEARHGHGWFWWQPTVRWQNQTHVRS